MITRYFNLFLNAGSASPLVISANQYDHGEQWVFTLYSQLGVKYEPSSGAIVGVKSDNLAVNYSGTVDSEGRVVINETTQMTAVAGRAIFELLIDGETHGTANFYVEVEPKPGDNADFSASDLSLIQEAINSIAIAGSGAPAVATLASEMTDEGKVYLYAGSETGYTTGHWYYYNGSAWTDGGKYGGTVDATLTMSGVAADAKKTGDEISDLKSEIAQGSGLTNDIKSALMNVVEHIGAWTDGNAQVYIENLRGALYPPANLVSISAVYTQGTVYDTDSLDSLKNSLVVTAHYDDSTSEVVTNYTLSGELTQGPSTITVTYGGKTTTFTVEVTHYTIPPLYNWDFTTSLTDTIEGQVATLGGSATQDANGVTLGDGSSYIDIGNLWATNRTIEIDVADSGNLSYSTNGRLLSMDASWGGGNNCGAIFQGATSSWTIYSGSWATASNVLALSAIKGKTIKYEITASKVNFYIDDVLAATSNVWTPKTKNLKVGSSGNSITNLTVTALRIYENSEA